MSQPKWYKLKSRNFAGISDQDFIPPEHRVDMSNSYIAKGSLEHCQAMKERFIGYNYPGELFIEECDYDGKVYPNMEEPEEPEEENPNKQIVTKSQEILGKLGYKVKTGHLYELFSQLSGFKTWNVASAKQANFSKVLNARVRLGGVYRTNDPDGATVRIYEIDGLYARGTIFQGFMEPIPHVIWRSDTGSLFSYRGTYPGPQYNLVEEITDPELAYTMDESYDWQKEYPNVKDLPGPIEKSNLVRIIDKDGSHIVEETK